MNARQLTVLYCTVERSIGLESWERPWSGAPITERELFGGAQGKEVLGAFDGVLKAAEELLEVFAALDEVDVGGVDDQEVAGGVAEEEVLVGVGYLCDVVGRDLGFVAGSFFRDARAEDLGLGLQIDD